MMCVNRKQLWLLMMIGLLLHPSAGAQDFPPNTITVLASGMPAKYSGLVDYTCDGVNDDVEINQAIADAAATGEGGTVLLVGGNFYVSDTIDVAETAGLIIRGLGVMTSLDSDTVSYGGWGPNVNSTALIWTGSSGGTMVNFHKSNHCRLENLLLFGRNGEESNVAGILLHISTQGSYGSGSHVVNNVCFQSATIGIQMGTSAGDNNCELTRFSNVEFHQLEKGFVQKNLQSLGNSFDNVRSAQCTEAVFYIETGGNLTVTHGTDTSSTAYLQLTTSASDEGPGSGPLNFTGIRMERTSGHINGAGTPVFLMGASGGSALVVVDGLATYGTDPSHADFTFEIEKGVGVIAKNSTFCGKIAKLRNDTSSSAAMLILDNCGIPALGSYTRDAVWSALLDFDPSYEYCQLIATNCYHGNTRLPEYIVNRSWKSVQNPVILWSNDVDLTQTGTQTIEQFGINMYFVPVEVGVVLLPSCNGTISTQPQISFGWTGSNTGLLATVDPAFNTAVGIYNKQTRKYDSLLTNDAKGNVTATVQTAATMSGASPVLKAKFYWVGYVMQSF